MTLSSSKAVILPWVVPVVRPTLPIFSCSVSARHLQAGQISQPFELSGIESDSLVQDRHGAVHEVRLALVEPDEVAQDCDPVLGIPAAIDRTGLDDGILAFLAPVLVGEDVVVREDHDRSIACGADETAESAGRDLEVADRAAKSQRPIPLLVPRLRRHLHDAADVAYVHFASGLLPNRLELRAAFKSTLLEPNRQDIIVMPLAAHAQGHRPCMDAQSGHRLGWNPERRSRDFRRRHRIDHRPREHRFQFASRIQAHRCKLLRNDRSDVMA